MIVLAFGLSVTVTLGLAAAGGAATAAPGSSQTGISSIRQSSVSALQSYLDRKPGEFGALYLDNRSHTVYVNVVSGGQPAAIQDLGRQVAADSAVGRGAQLRVAVRQVRYSQSQLSATMAAVTDRQPWVSIARPVLATWGIDPRSDKVIIGLTQITPLVAAAAHTTFGDEVSLVRQQRPQLAIGLTALPPGYRTVKLSLPHKGTVRGATPSVAPSPSRLLDALPYYGGDRIYRLISLSGQTYVEECTVAFTWSTPGMTSAGHCGPTGTVWTQGYLDTSNNTLYKTGSMGTVQDTQYGTNRPDDALITKSSWAPYVYTALQNWLPVGGPDAPYVGDTVCTDGSFTGQNCTAVVSQRTICTNVKNPITGTFVYICDLDVATSSNSTTLVQPGDSGGPVYVNLSGTLYANGLICAGNSARTTVWFTDIANVISTLGGTVAKAG
jgi:hypothetical protein